MDDILAAGPDFILNHQSSVIPHLARHLGFTTPGLRHHVSSERELIQLICQRHLSEAFDAVCVPADWCGTPIEVVRAMGLALLHYAAEKPSRHLVFLLHRHGLNVPARSDSDTMLMYLTNNFQIALQDVHPEKPFDTLNSAARMLLGQLLHVPLWWPAEPHLTQDEWLCHLIGQLTDTALPDWRAPVASHVERQDSLSHWGDRQDTDLPSQYTA